MTRQVTQCNINENDNNWLDNTIWKENERVRNRGFEPSYLFNILIVIYIYITIIFKKYPTYITIHTTVSIIILLCLILSINIRYNK